MRLFHFSEDPGIAHFDPRPVAVPAKRPPGREWLNGPLVWAIEARWQAMYLFPRDCPRIVLTPTDRTTPEDQERFWEGGDWSAVAYVEESWLDRIAQATVYRYEMPPKTFEDLQDAGMWVSRTPATPLRVDAIDDLLAAQAAAKVALRPLPSLAPLKDVWSTTLHASGVRLRNAQGGWPPP